MSDTHHRDWAAGKQKKEREHLVWNESRGPEQPKHRGTIPLGVLTCRFSAAVQPAAVWVASSSPPHSDVGSFGRSCGGLDARVGLVGVPWAVCPGRWLVWLIWLEYLGEA